MFKKNHQIIFSVILISGFCFGCSGASEFNSAKNNGGNQPTVVANTNAAALPSAPVTAVNVNSPAASNNQTANVNKGVKNLPAAKEPMTKIGSGGDDLALFAQVRSAFSADPELFNGVIVEIKEGRAALSGKVSSEEKKKKAEQLVQNISGIKSVKNNVRVAP
jgi:hypothetical protein